MINRFIKNLRREMGFSQEYMSKQLKMSRPTYMSIEEGKREITISEAQAIANVFKISMNELINEKIRKIEVNVLKDSNNIQYEKIDIRISVPQKHMDKFKEVLLYVLSQVGCKPNIGETAIYKLLYFIDFDYYEKYEEQLIGATYIKNTFGPTPVEFAKLTKEMTKKKEIQVIKNSYHNYKQTKYIALRDANLSTLLSAQEIKHIDNVLERLSNMNAKQLSEYSHQDIPWITTESGEPIDYESVFYRTPVTSVREYEDEEI